jgi:hemerythrin-like domain-containing protein
MATSTTAKKQTRSQDSSAKTTDAIALLKSDHQAVDAAFKALDTVKDDAEPEEIGEIVQKVCAMLTVHAQIEEEIFYPAMRDGVDDVDDLLNEADVEHGTVKDLIARLERMDPSDEMYTANATVLAEYVKHHVKEEEGELFPKAAKSDLDLDALGAELAARKQELESALVR